MDSCIFAVCISYVCAKRSSKACERVKSSARQFGDGFEWFNIRCNRARYSTIVVMNIGHISYGWLVLWRCEWKKANIKQTQTILFKYFQMLKILLFFFSSKAQTTCAIFSVILEFCLHILSHFSWRCFEMRAHFCRLSHVWNEPLNNFNRLHIFCKYIFFSNKSISQNSFAYFIDFIII